MKVPDFSIFGIVLSFRGKNMPDLPVAPDCRAPARIRIRSANTNK